MIGRLLHVPSSKTFFRRSSDPKLISILLAIAFLNFTCPTYEPTVPANVPTPTITGGNIDGIFIRDAYREAIRIQWEMPGSDTLSGYTFTILRKSSSDSSYVLPFGARDIPDTVTEFIDEIADIGFPQLSYDSVFYRVFAVDSVGHPGDSSAPFKIMLATQAQFDTLDQYTWCTTWSSQGIQGSVASYATLWNANQIIWKSGRFTDFGQENDNVTFSTCFPDSLLPLSVGKWYIGFFLEANGFERQSLRIYSFDISR